MYQNFATDRIVNSERLAKSPVYVTQYVNTENATVLRSNCILKLCFVIKEMQNIFSVLICSYY